MIAKYKGKSYELKGKKCILAGFTAKQLPLFVKWMTNPEVNTFLSWNYASQTLKKEKKWYDHLRKSKLDVCFGIYVDEGKKKKIIGTLSLKDVSSQNYNAEFGIVIGEKEYWSKGIGSEATKLILKFGFNVMKLNSIYLTVSPNHKGGQKAYKRTGFKKAVYSENMLKKRKNMKILYSWI